MSTITTISKGGLSAKIDSMGAQLTSLSFDGHEYLWQADPRWWGRSAPVLFPIVGSLRNNEAVSAAGPCKLGRHGIARLYEHRLVRLADDGASVTYELTESPETLEAFPYQFKLNMTYAVLGEATFTQTFAVTNTGDADLPFSVGGHPAFNVPAPGGAELDEAFEDYELVFTKPWSCKTPDLTADGLMDWKNAYYAIKDADVMPISRSTFDHDTVMFTDVPDHTVMLRGTKSGHGVQVDFPDFKFLGLWSAANDAPFVALEPWTGHASCTDEDGVFEHKDNTIVLGPGETDVRSFSITLF